MPLEPLPREGQEYRAKAVGFYAHVQTTCLKLVGADHPFEEYVQRVEKNLMWENGFGKVIPVRSNELPRTMRHMNDPYYYITNARPKSMPQARYMYNAIGDYHKKATANGSGCLAMTFFKIDPESGLRGNNALFAWGPPMASV